MKTKQELKKYFENGDIPVQEEFWEWQESYWHKDEKIDMQKVSGLENGTFNLLYAEMDTEKNASLAFFMKRKIIIKPGTLSIPKNFAGGLGITNSGHLTKYSGKRIFRKWLNYIGNPWPCNGYPKLGFFR
ncbi:hypothetical protein [Chryseobacterium sp. ON_d1]|uniref:hypothetical protein n=1 Tax=Chryseobacterium sp. ON_d1 TaxID=2583211 RepID=UPI00116D1645|nr:hypothetical protein [Chryseobacterium sp. ON_d1]GEJ47981.1 hypothetical protein CRS_45900 [Chryseobacterium sp. ON_d1]